MEFSIMYQNYRCNTLCVIRDITANRFSRNAVYTYNCRSSVDNPRFHCHAFQNQLFYLRVHLCILLLNRNLIFWLNFVLKKSSHLCIHLFHMPVTPVTKGCSYAHHYFRTFQGIFSHL